MMHSEIRFARRGAAVALWAATGCYLSHERPDAWCHLEAVESVRRETVREVDRVDLLLMVDNSGSMAEEQASLAEQIPRLVRALVTGDADDDGVVDFRPVQDLHVGVITPDMGTGGHRVPTCHEPLFGDDGVLRTDAPVGRGCGPRYPSVLSYSPGVEPDAFARDVSCVARRGTGGCGFEQQLEAVLKALTPSSSPLRFQAGTRGHGDGANAGFLRPDSLLAIVMLTDEEDCSVADPELFAPFTTVYPGDMNLRCFLYPSAVHPIARYVDGLRALRADEPGLLLFAAITGVPVDLVDGVGDPPPETYDYFARILADPRMQERPDPSGMGLVPSCDVPGRGVAMPPRRIVAVASALQTGLDGSGRSVPSGGASHGIVQSICQADFTPVARAIVARIGQVLAVSCIERDLAPDIEGRVPCELHELSDAPDCGVPGRQLVGRDSDGRTRCRVAQLPVDADGRPSGGAGWYFDWTSDEVRRLCPPGRGQIAWAPGSRRPGVELRLYCQPDAIPCAGPGRACPAGSVCREDLGFCADMECVDPTRP
ncbi:MAG: hypothetical protein NZ898_01545 [Myxococcota bacterium]|nr:hypothetical protein [Myxococcota bacterium]MDW8362489.1 hypothetical protein [Myxococcales bacterium]